MEAAKVVVVAARHLDSHIAEDFSAEQALDRILRGAQRMMIAEFQHELLAVLRGIRAEFVELCAAVDRQRGLVRPDDRAVRIDDEDALGQTRNDLLQLTAVDLRFRRGGIHNDSSTENRL